MNNDELKKKIADIIYHTGCTGACCECDYLKHSDADTYCKAMLKASALIAAGIGDVKEAERKLFVFKNELAEMIQCFTRMETLYKIKSEEVKIKEHRAEVAERAVHFLVYDNSEYTYDDAIEQAEKELSEERECRMKGNLNR